MPSECQGVVKVESLSRICTCKLFVHISIKNMFNYSKFTSKKNFGKRLFLLEFLYPKNILRSRFESAMCVLCVQATYVKEMLMKVLILALNFQQKWSMGVAYFK